MDIDSDENQQTTEQNCRRSSRASSKRGAEKIQEMIGKPQKRSKTFSQSSKDKVVKKSLSMSIKSKEMKRDDPLSNLPPRIVQFILKYLRLSEVLYSIIGLNSYYRSMVYKIMVHLERVDLSFVFPEILDSMGQVKLGQNAKKRKNKFLGMMSKFKNLRHLHISNVISLAAVQANQHNFYNCKPTQQLVTKMPWQITLRPYFKTLNSLDITNITQSTAEGLGKDLKKCVCLESFAFSTTWETKFYPAVEYLIEYWKLRTVKLLYASYSQSANVKVMADLMLNEKLESLYLAFYPYQRYRHLSVFQELEDHLKASEKPIRPILKSLKLFKNYRDVFSADKIVEYLKKQTNLQELFVNLGYLPEVLIEGCTTPRNLKILTLHQPELIQARKLKKFVEFNGKTLEELSLVSNESEVLVSDLLTIFGACPKLQRFYMASGDLELRFKEQGEFGDLSDYLLSETHPSLVSFNDIRLKPDHTASLDGSPYFVIDNRVPHLRFNIHLMQGLIKKYPDVMKVRLHAPHANFRSPSGQDFENVPHSYVYRRNYLEDQIVKDLQLENFGFDSENKSNFLFSLDDRAQMKGEHTELDLNFRGIQSTKKEKVCWVAEKCTSIPIWEVTNSIILDKLSKIPAESLHLAVEDWWYTSQYSSVLANIEHVRSFATAVDWWTLEGFCELVLSWKKHGEGLASLTLSQNKTAFLWFDLSLQMAEDQIENLTEKMKGAFSDLTNLTLRKLRLGDDRMGEPTISMDLFQTINYELLRQLVIEDTTLTETNLETLTSNLKVTTNLTQLEIRNVHICPIGNDEARIWTWHTAIEKILTQLINREGEIEDFILFPSYPSYGYIKKENRDMIRRIFVLIQTFIEERKAQLRSFWIRILPTWAMFVEYNSLFLPMLNKDEYPQLKYLFGCELDVVNSNQHLNQIFSCHKFYQKSANSTSANAIIGDDILLLLVEMYEQKRIFLETTVEKSRFKVYSVLGKTTMNIGGRTDFTDNVVAYYLAGQKTEIKTIIHTGPLFPDYLSVFNSQRPKGQPLTSFQLNKTYFLTASTKQREDFERALQELECSKITVNPLSSWSNYTPICPSLPTLASHPMIEIIEIACDSSSKPDIPYLTLLFQNKKDFREIIISNLRWTDDCQELVEAIKENSAKRLTLVFTPSVAADLLSTFNLDNYEYLELLDSLPFKGGSENKTDLKLFFQKDPLILFNKFYTPNGIENSLTLNLEVGETEVPHSLLNDALNRLPTLTKVQFESMAIREEVVITMASEILTVQPKLRIFEFGNTVLTSNAIIQIIRSLVSAKLKTGANTKGKALEFQFRELPQKLQPEGPSVRFRASALADLFDLDASYSLIQPDRLVIKATK